MKGLSHSEVQLINAMRDLHRDWDWTATNWHDKARADFEKEYILALEAPLRGAINAISEINRMLRKAIQDCS
jgi:hypothetical protein